METMKRLENILKGLEERVYKGVEQSYEHELCGYKGPVEIGDMAAWVEDYNLRLNTFTVCVCGKNALDHPNVEKYLSEELEERIPDLAVLLNEAEEERENEWRGMEYTYSCLRQCM